VLQDHERIAADLHDHVIQDDVSRSGWVAGMVGGLARPEHQTRILGIVDALDTSIRRLRSSILPASAHPPAVSTACDSGC